MAATHIGQTVVWGTPTGVSYGICTSYDEDHQASLANVENEQGAVSGLVKYDGSVKVSLTCSLTSDTDGPTPGTLVTVNGVQIVVESARKSRSNKGIATLTVAGTHYDNLSAGTGGGSAGA